MARRTAVTTRVVQALAGVGGGLSDRELLARFAAGGDQAAFAAVVTRHTSLVLGVCRRALARAADAEDACQAVFLLLAEKAQAGRTPWQASVAGWLYTAARKVARNARVAADRRARRERRAAVPESVAAVDTVTGRELLLALDEELDRLPARYREPLVLCYLEGLTQDEAAARLSVGKATLTSQLKRGRKKLADALTARGYEAGAILLMAGAASAATASGKLRDAILAAAAGAPSAAAAALARGGSMFGMSNYLQARLLIAACLAAAIGLGIAAARPTADQPPSREAPPAKTAEATVRRLGETRFRADRPVGDARYGAGGKRIVGHAGTILYVWDAGNGSVLRRIETGLAELDDPGNREFTFAFAVHPRKSWVACGGRKAGRTHLQVWDFETGKAVADAAGGGDTLTALAWTPGGERLLERANRGEWDKPTAWKLIVRDERLAVVHSHDLPQKFGDWPTVVCPLAGDQQAILWQSGWEPTVFDLESGRAVRTIAFKPSLPSDLAVSPDGKLLAATASNEMRLLHFPGGDTHKELPVHRRGWESFRPLFSPDGKTVYVYDFRPFAYDVATGRERWRATPRTTHTVRMLLCDVSPDGAALLVRHGHGVALLDAKTGAERDPTEAPAVPTGFVWSPDGRKIFTRATNHDRTWTAWDAVTGKRIYDLRPTGFVKGENWKMLPDLFFIRGGKEIVVGLEKVESTERVGPKDLFVFDTATGRCLRRLGDPLGDPLPEDRFRWMHPIAVDRDGASVVMQAYAVSAAPGPAGAGGGMDTSREYTFQTLRWDPVKRAKLQEWEVVGYRTDPPRHYAPYYVTRGLAQPDGGNDKRAPARIRCYSLTDGQLVHELHTDFGSVEPDRVQGNFLLAEGYDRNVVARGPYRYYRPQPPFAYDLWELPSRTKVRVFESAERTPAVLGPAARYVLRVRDDHTVEVHEPFVLKRVVAKVATASRPAQFEFAPDGGRVAVSFADTSVAIWDTTAWRKQVEEQLAQALPADLTPLWDGLAKDAATGLRAAGLLSAAGDRAVTLLAGKVGTQKAPDEAQVKRLITDLDSTQFAVREAAAKELRELSVAVRTPLQQAARATPSLEVRRRIERLLAAIDARELTATERRELRAVQALVWMDREAARALLAKWAAGPPDATRTQAARQALGR